MTDEISPQEAAAQLMNPPEEERAAEPEVAQEDAPAEEEKEKETPESREQRLERLRKMGPPMRSFRWVDDSELTVVNWLGGIATADIEVFPGVVFRFIEASEQAMNETNALVNSMGPAFVMTGLLQPNGHRDDLVRGEQWNRARNVAMVVASVTTMGGDPWPEGKTLRERFNEVAGMGHIKVERLIAAMSEFTETLAYVIEVGDLPNS